MGCLWVLLINSFNESIDVMFIEFFDLFVKLTNGWLVRWLVGLMVGWLVGWFDGWLV